MIEFLRGLAQFLAGDVDVDAVAAKVGPIETDPGWPVPMELRPTAPVMSTARLARYPESGLPYALTIEPVDKMRPTVAELKSAFGAYQQVRTHRGMAPEVMFTAAPTGPHWRVALIARLHSALEDVETSKVDRIVFRRDPADGEAGSAK